MTDRFALVPASYVYLLRDGAGGTEVLLQRRGPVPYMPDHWAAAAAGQSPRLLSPPQRSGRFAAMAIDTYAPCPGGTGKKIKFCCSDLVGDTFRGIERADSCNRSTASSNSC